MGKGDRKTKRGKILKGTFGVRRPKKNRPSAAAEAKPKKTAAKKAAPKKAAAKKSKN